MYLFWNVDLPASRPALKFGISFLFCVYFHCFCKNLEFELKVLMVSEFNLFYGPLQFPAPFNFMARVSTLSLRCRCGCAYTSNSISLSPCCCPALVLGLLVACLSPVSVIVLGGFSWLALPLLGPCPPLAIYQLLGSVLVVAPHKPSNFIPCHITKCILKLDCLQL